VIYASDPEPEPDTDFLPGELRHLVAGTRGRLLDARRTPVTIIAVAAATGAFELEIGAFEDAGARWELPLADVGRFQFARGGLVAAPEVVAELERASVRFAREVVLGSDPAARAETMRRVAAERSAVRERLARAGRGPRARGGHGHPIDLAVRIAERDGDPGLFELVDDVMAAHGVAEIEDGLSATFVSNPRSGEHVKGHAIVLAELGLCPYRGQIVRDPGLFDEPWTRRRRAAHIVARLALIQELWSSWGLGTVTAFRGAAVDGPLPDRPPSSFVSATLSREVAAAHFEGGPSTRTAVLWRQEVAVSRLFMTFLETRELNRRFKEAEAVLIGDPDNRAF
jgi:hypothetical protein